MADKPRVFVSCGQHTAEEKNLGKNICELVREVRPDLDPYYAETYSSAQGVSNHVLEALYRASAVICVMHKRGAIQRPDGNTIIRGSVWIEQEIGILAFMNNVLGRDVPVLFYKENEIGLEGIRSVILLNQSCRFLDGSEILDDLRQRLPKWSVSAFQQYAVEPVVESTCPKRQPGTCWVDLSVAVENTGQELVRDFRLDMYVPRAFLTGC